MVMLEKPDNSHALQHDQRPAEFQDKLDARVSRGLAAGADRAHEAPVVVRGRTTVDEAYKVWNIEFRAPQAVLDVCQFQILAFLQRARASREPGR